MTIKPQGPQSDAISLEAIIDRHGLHAVIDMLGFICGEKAEHIATNWQDANLAKRWNKAGQLIDKFAPQVDALKLS